jgi:hypothetical protein
VRAAWAAALAGVAALSASGAGHGLAASRGEGRASREKPLVARAAVVPVADGLYFEANRGQTDARVRFLARPRGYRAFFTDDGVVFSLPRGTGLDRASVGRNAAPPIAGDAVRMRFPGSLPCAVPAAAVPLPGRSNYFPGSDRSQWVKGAPHCGELITRGLWQGVDLRWRGLPGRGLEYDLLVAPGADPGAIAIAFDGAKSAALDAEGNLEVRTDGGVLRHGRPSAWKETGGRRIPVEARFAARKDGTFGFEVGGRDAALPLVIDPTIDFATYLGGGDMDSARSVATDADGGTYLTGTTWSADFPTAFPFQGPLAGPLMAGFLTKIAPGGGSLVFSTYFGGNSGPMACAVDGSGAVYMTGFRGDTVPIVNSPFGSDATLGASFVAKFNASGDTLLYSIPFGGAHGSEAHAIAVDANGSAVVVGGTQSSDFYTTPNLPSGFTPGYRGGFDAFVTQFSPTGESLGISFYFGGTKDDIATGVAFAPNGDIVVAGTTKSTDLPTRSPSQATLAGKQDAFVARFSLGTPALVWSTYLGGKGDEMGSVAFDYSGPSVGVDPGGTTWVSGTTNSTDFPLLNAIRTSFAGSLEGFVTKLSSSGVPLVSSFLGGGGDETVYGMAVDPKGGVYIAGKTTSTDFPLKSEVQSQKGGGEDAFVTVLLPLGTSIHFSSFFGGSANDVFYGVAVDGKGLVHLGGSTLSTGLGTPGAVQGSKAASTDAFAVTLAIPPLPPFSCAATLVGMNSANVTWVDGSLDETGFELHRKSPSVGFTTVRTTAPDVNSYLDEGLDYGTVFTYRVRAVHPDGNSAFSNEAMVTTPYGPPPATPSGLVATVVPPREVDLSWVDNSDDEDAFLVERGQGDAIPDALANAPRDATTYADTTVLSDRSYTFDVKAVNKWSPSGPSNAATVTLPATLGFVLSKGKIVDSLFLARDSFKAAGTVTYLDGAEATKFDPAVASFEVHLGGWEAPAVVSIPAGDKGWKHRKATFSWKNPKGSPEKAKVVVNAARGTVAVTVSRLQFGDRPRNPIRIAIGLGADGVTREGDWTLGHLSGQFRYP